MCLIFRPSCEDDSCDTFYPVQKARLQACHGKELVTGCNGGTYTKEGLPHRNGQTTEAKNKSSTGLNEADGDENKNRCRNPCD
ncbi:hypothetical protein AA0312_2889 [Acetobacter tropicalis NRIC 0312]|nr:hypothetical protein ATR1_446c0020 [Acetobacter tropicalis]GBR72376.1 hypothetical protein AA0312_2889 [Acetobacter tropicalis NRIC 0312]